MMHVVYASDDGFCPHLAVSMFSLLDHNENEDVELHILANGICEENRERLEGIAEGFGRDIHFYEMDGLAEGLSLRVEGLDTGKFHITTLARLLVGSILPEDISRVLYLDADTVVLRSLRKLYETPLRQCVAAAVAEPTIYPQVKEEIGLEQNEPYFNAGVLLLNLKCWREEGLEEQAFAYYRKKQGKLAFNDQDVINAVLRDRMAVLPQKNNFFSNYYYFHYETLRQMAPWYGSCETADSFAQARSHPVIVHFAGDERPWIGGSRNPYRRAYQLYLRATPWADMPKTEGKRLYMAVYHVMNLLTWLAPKTRQLISRSYYENRIRHTKL